MYQIVNDPITKQLDCIRRIADNAFFPPNPENTDYQAYLKWLSEGNTPESAE